MLKLIRTELIVLVLVTQLWMTVAATAGGFLIPASAVPEFVSSVDLRTISTKQYVEGSALGGIQLPVPWHPELSGQTWYAVFSMRGTKFLFGPLASAEECGPILKQLVGFKARLDGELRRLTGDSAFQESNIYPLFIMPGQTLEQGFGDGFTAEAGAQIMIYLESLEVLDAALDVVDKAVDQYHELQRTGDESTADRLEHMADSAAFVFTNKKVITDLVRIQFGERAGNSDTPITEEDAATFIENLKATQLLSASKSAFGGWDKPILDATEAAADAVNTTAASGKGSSGGANGPFKCPMAFSQWFVNILSMVAQYLGIKDISQFVLVYAYMLAPDAFEQIGTALARFQRAMTTDKLDQVLDDLTWLAKHAGRIVAARQEILDLIHHKASVAAFHDVLKKLDLHPERLPGVPRIIGEAIDRLDSLRTGGFGAYAKEIFSNQFKKQFNSWCGQIPVLRHASLSSIYEAYKSGDVSGFVRNVVTDQVRQILPPWSLPGFDSAINGNLEAAGEEIAVAGMERGFSKAGIPLFPAREVFDQLQGGDPIGAGQTILRSQAQRIGPYAEAGRHMLNGNLDSAFISSSVIALGRAVPPEVEVVLGQFARGMNAEQISADYLNRKWGVDISPVDVLTTFSKGPDLTEAARRIREALVNSVALQDLLKSGRSVREILETGLADLSPVVTAWKDGISTAPEDWGRMPYLRNIQSMLDGIEHEAPAARLVLPLWRESDKAIGMLAAKTFEGRNQLSNRLAEAGVGAGFVQLLERLRNEGKGLQAWRMAAQEIINGSPSVSMVPVAANEILNGRRERALDILLGDTVAFTEDRFLSLCQELASQFPELGPAELWWRLPDPEPHASALSSISEWIETETNGEVKKVAELASDRDLLKSNVMESVVNLLPADDLHLKNLLPDLISEDRSKTLVNILEAFGSPMDFNSTEAARQFVSGQLDSALTSEMAARQSAGTVPDRDVLAAGVNLHLLQLRVICDIVRQHLTPEEYERLFIQRAISATGRHN